MSTASTNEISGRGSIRGVAPLKERPSRTREVLEAIREAILHGELAPGHLYSVAELAESFGISRTPVREALIELASRGMVRFERNRGVRVVEWNNTNLAEIFDLRMMIEVPATRRAVENVPPEVIKQLRRCLDDMHRAGENNATSDPQFWVLDRLFHRLILEGAGNSRLVEYIEGLRDLILLRDATTAGRSRSREDIAREHEEILAAVEAGDADAAAAAMESHLLQTLELLRAQ